MAKAYWISCYRSVRTGYQEALRVLGDAVERDLRIVEGEA